MTILILTAGFVLITYVFGALYTVVSDAIRRHLISVAGWTGFCILGFIGVPFHELTHLITALIFNHAITGVALYRPIGGKSDGKLGYVNHNYNCRSLYQTAGNFFIGSAPMIFGAGLLVFLLHQTLQGQIVVNCSVSWQSLLENFLTNIVLFWQVLRTGNFYAILTLFAAIAICPHIGMSKADFGNTTAGVLFLLVASIVVPYVIYCNFDIGYEIMSMILFRLLAEYLFMLIMGLAISIVIYFLVKIIDIFV